MGAAQRRVQVAALPRPRARSQARRRWRLARLPLPGRLALPPVWRAGRGRGARADLRSRRLGCWGGLRRSQRRGGGSAMTRSSAICTSRISMGISSTRVARCATSLATTWATSARNGIVIQKAFRLVRRPMSSGRRFLRLISGKRGRHRSFPARFARTRDKSQRRGAEDGLTSLRHVRQVWQVIRVAGCGDKISNAFLVA